jgi:hypothetical protein
VGVAALQMLADVGVVQLELGQLGLCRTRTVNRCAPLTSTPPSTSAAPTWPWYLQQQQQHLQQT